MNERTQARPEAASCTPRRTMRTVMFHLALIASILTQSHAAETRDADGRIQDTPSYHWIFAAKRDATKMGLMGGYPDGLGYQPRPGLSRTDVIVVFHAIAANLHNIDEDLKSFATRPLSDSKAVNNRKEVVEFFVGEDRQSIDRIVSALRRMPQEFAPEIKALGISPGYFPTAATDLLAMASGHIPGVGSALSQFPDVPENHWAAKAILELRRAGILDGYPDGRFGG